MYPGQAASDRSGNLNSRNSSALANSTAIERLNPTTMPFAGDIQNLTFDRSSLYEVHGHYYGTTTPAEKGIKKLRKAACPDAFHDSQMRYPPPRCSPRTREDVIKDIFEWMARGKERLMWLSGSAGAGKSAIAQTVSELCAKDGTLVGSFFFLRGAPGRNSTESLIASIAYQLATSMPNKRTQLGEIVENDPLIFRRSLEAQVQTLLIPLFLRKAHGDISDMDMSPQPSPFIIIIDGLDECAGDNNQRDVVKVISSLVHANDIFIRCLLSSRPEPQIAESIRHLPWTVCDVSLSDKIRILEAERNIRALLYEEFLRIYYKRYEALLQVEKPWPSENIIDSLVRKSAGIFIYATTILRYIDDDDYHPADRLDEVLHVPRGSKPFAELDLLYQHIMSTCQNIPLLIHILTVRFLSQYAEGDGQMAFCGREIEFLLELRPGTVSMVLRRMHSILRVETSSYITMLHTSFQDFIHNEDRAGNYAIEKADGHRLMAQTLLRFIARSTQKTITEDLQWVSQYARKYWPTHCMEAGTCSENPHLVEELSKTLTLCPLFQRSWERTLHEVFDNLTVAIRWLEVDELKARLFTCNPLVIQYQLFKTYFHQEAAKPAPTQIRIFMLYESVSSQHASRLLGQPFRVFNSPDDCFIQLAYDEIAYIRNWNDLYRRTGIGADRSADRSTLSRLSGNFEWKEGNQISEYETIYVSVENAVYRRRGSDLRFPVPDSTLNRLTKQFIHEEGNLIIMGSHTHIVCRCLALISEGHPLDTSEPQEYFYAQRHWTKHLLHVPPGNLEIVGAIQKLNLSILHYNRTQEEIIAIQSWLKASELVMRTQGYGFFMFTCF